MQEGQSRLTVTECVYHQKIHEDPIQSESRYQRLLETGEQPWLRHLTVESKWTPLDCGWLDEVSMLIIHNKEASLVTTEEGEEVVEDIDPNLPTLEVKFKGAKGSWLVQPGASMRAEPSSIENLQVRSLYGTTKITIYAFPK